MNSHQSIMEDFFSVALTDENVEILSAPVSASSSSSGASSGSQRSLPAILGGRKRKAAEPDHQPNQPNQPNQQSEPAESMEQDHRRVLAAVQNVRINNTSSSSRQPLSTLHSDNNTDKPRTVIMGRQKSSSDNSFQPMNPTARRRLIGPSGSSSSSKTQHSKQLKKPSTSRKGIKPPPAKKMKMRQSWSQFREYVDTSLEERPRCSAPFPTLKWADREEMWELICKKETGMYKRKDAQQILSAHPNLMPKMRAILLDWLIEVCEVYRLHRETFYLAVDFFDRYLSVTKDMPKNRLQLVGVTCLFIGAKIEEIYPPKLTEFAYVTDGACTEDEILNMELVVIKELKWGLSPMTPNGWMKIYMQATNCDQSPDNETFVLPQYSGLPFARAMQLMDLVTLDMSSLQFPYSIMAATAFAISQNDVESAVKVSGYAWEDLSRCHEWMSIFWQQLRQESPTVQIKSFHNVNAENQHNIQTHTVDLKVLDATVEESKRRLEDAPFRTPSSSSISSLPNVVLETPPESARDVRFKQDYRSASLTSSSSGSSVFFTPETPCAVINPDDLHRF